MNEKLIKIRRERKNEGKIEKYEWNCGSRKGEKLKEKREKTNITKFVQWMKKMIKKEKERMQKHRYQTIRIRISNNMNKNWYQKRNKKKETTRMKERLLRNMKKEK